MPGVGLCSHSISKVQTRYLEIRLKGTCVIHPTDTARCSPNNLKKQYNVAVET